jgi:hypothetical protein
VGTVADEGASPPSPVPMLPYVGFFALIFVPGLIVLFLVFLLFQSSPPVHLDSVMIFGAGTWTHWRFLKRWRRRLGRAEFWRVVGGALVVTTVVSMAFGVSLIALYGARDILASPWFWGGGLLLSAPIDLALLSGAFTAGGSQMLGRILAADPVPPTQPIEPR